MTRLALWGIILGGMVATYATRLSFTVLVPQERLPRSFRRGLAYVPPAVLSAIILPGLVRPDGPLDLLLHNHRMLAGLLAALIAWRTRNVWATIIIGMVALWLLSLL